MCKEACSCESCSCGKVDPELELKRKTCVLAIPDMVTIEDLKASMPKDISSELSEAYDIILADPEQMLEAVSSSIIVSKVLFTIEDREQDSDIIEDAIAKCNLSRKFLDEQDSYPKILGNLLDYLLQKQIDILYPGETIDEIYEGD